ncbi:MAG: tRNA uridine-5-carboxymethylaminomethyl(34) synthesis GTPase MnmE [Oscillospiraceae bacterium]|nr:tRNA uridine-5-carboxymethylaminomethyl(34) synthesis GTPase MnmE [Oscillospiraceae bacterium]
MNLHSNTIAAVATPRGNGGIAVIRISGPSAFEIGGRIFTPKSKKYGSFADIPPNTAVFGGISQIDEGLALKFLAPHSYTGENTVEISCHGGSYIANAVLAAAIAAGARPAEAGEFTKTAYLNGKISLTGAEAVGRLIMAKNERGAKLALAQAKGGLSKKIGAIAEKIKDMISEVYVEIDYPGEQLADIAPEAMLLALGEIKSELDALKESYNIGRIISEGISCAIVGKPNSGKSTLLNALSGEEVAIVHQTPGTTRDVVASRVNLGEFVINFYDTAGLRESGDEIERLGIEKTHEKIAACELILGVFEANNFDELDRATLEILKREQKNGKKIVPILNKCDLPDCEGVGADFGAPPLLISAKANFAVSGLSVAGALAKYLEDIYRPGDYGLEEGEVLTEERQYLEILAACENLESAIASLKLGFSQDVAGLSLELAARSLGRCDSRQVSEDIVEKIFKNFCVGK